MHSGMLYAGYVEFLGNTYAGAHEYCIKTSIKQVIDGEINTACTVQVEMDTKILNFLNLTSHHLLGQAIFRYAKLKHATCFRLHLKYFYRKSLAREVARYGKSGRSAPYHGHSATCFLRDQLMRYAGLTVKVGHKTLQFTHMDGGVFLPQHAVTLTLALMCAYAAAHCGQVASRVDDGHGVTEVAFGKFCYPFGHFIAYRTTFLACSHLAQQASLRLAYCFRECIITGDLLEVSGIVISLFDHYFAAIFAQLSFKPTVLLKTICSAVVSGSTT